MIQLNAFKKQILAIAAIINIKFNAIILYKTVKMNALSAITAVTHVLEFQIMNASLVNKIII